MALLEAHLRNFRDFLAKYRGGRLAAEDLGGAGLVALGVGFFFGSEAQKISERTKAGLARARAKGKVLGRPRRADIEAAVRAKLAEGVGMLRIARALSLMPSASLTLMVASRFSRSRK